MSDMFTKKSLTLNTSLKSLFYGVFTVLFLTGLAWFLLKNNETETITTLKFWLIKIHGAAAMLALLVLGWMIPTHIQLGWQRKKNAGTGSVMITACIILVVTGYGLYYFGGESIRNTTSLIHSVVGCLVPVLLGWHIRQGRRKKRLKGQ